MKASSRVLGRQVARVLTVAEVKAIGGNAGPRKPEQGSPTMITVCDTGSSCAIDDIETYGD